MYDNVACPESDDKFEGVPDFVVSVAECPLDSCSCYSSPKVEALISIIW